MIMNFLFSWRIHFKKTSHDGNSEPGSLGLCVMQPKTAKTSLDQDYTFS